MTLWTLAQIRTKVQNDLDLQDETMITASELTAYINQAIDETEQLVITIYEDYLLQETALPLVTGTSEYDLPANIYAHKIRKVFYNDGGTKYEVKRVRDLSQIPHIEASENYRYVVMMNSAGQFRLKLYPASRETSTSNVTIWHIGNANTLSLDDDILNIPEAAQFVICRAKLECARKEGHPIQVTLAGEVEKQRELLIETLTNMVPDEDNEILIQDPYADMN